MADLDSLKSSLLVGITGLDSQGGETTPLVVNPDGSINVLQVAGENIKVSSNDQTTGYLQQKIIGTTNKILVTVQDEGNDEKLVINAGSNLFDKTLDTATQVVNTPSGNISSTNIQAAINELDSEKAKLSGGNAFSGDQTISGKIGIGVLTPSNDLEIQSISPEVLIKGTSSTGISFIDLRNDTSNYTEIGTYGSIQGSTSFGQPMANSSFIFSSASKLVTGTFGSSPLIFGTNSNERVRITETGQLSVGNTTPNTSAIVDITSTTSGFLMPRMTSAQRNAITSPINGLLVYDTTDTQFYYYTGSQWISITSLTQLNLKADKTTTISAGTGLTGGGDLSTNRTISMPNVGTAGTYGSASQVPVITTDTQGRVSGVTNTTISITTSAVSDFASSVLTTVLTGLSLLTSTAITASDTIISAMGKLQAQITILFNRTISAGYGLTGGGDLSANRSFAVNLAYTDVSATNTITTTSATNTLMTNMTLTPAAGTYLVLFSASLSGGNNDSTITVSIYAGGTLQSGSECLVVPNVSGGLADPLTTTISAMSFNIVTVNGSQAIEGRWRRSSGTATASYRHLKIIRIG